MSRIAKLLPNEFDSIDCDVIASVHSASQLVDNSAVAGYVRWSAYVRTYVPAPTYVRIQDTKFRMHNALSNNYTEANVSTSLLYNYETKAMTVTAIRAHLSFGTLASLSQ